MTPADEEVAVVDRHNTVIGCAPRARMRSEKLIHRATYILVINDAEDLFVHQRTLGKDIYPGYFDIAAGGVVLAGESYEQSAERELREELGVNAPLTRHFDHYFEDTHNRVWGRIFSCRHNGPFQFQPEEVADGFFLAIREVLALAKHHPFTPDGVAILQRFLTAEAIRQDATETPPPPCR